MQIRDRVRELRRVRAGDLAPHPDNWRTHPQRQQDALRGVLAEVGYADALLVRELPDGRLQLLDGHLRAETTPGAIVPVLVVDLNEDEARLVLLTHDPLAALAERDAEAFDRLRAGLEIESQAVRELLNELQHEPAGLTPIEPSEVDIRESFTVVVECEDEQEQRLVFNQMRAAGRKCRVLTI